LAGRRGIRDEANGHDAWSRHALLRVQETSLDRKFYEHLASISDFANSS
jgi:hypothetical protein